MGSLEDLKAIREKGVSLYALPYLSSLGSLSSEASLARQVAVTDRREKPMNKSEPNAWTHAPLDALTHYGTHPGAVDGGKK